MFETPDFSMLQTTSLSPVNKSFADTQFKILKFYIQEFEHSLDSEHEVGLLLTNFGQSILMQVTNISFEYPVLLIFQGFVNGHPSTLIQHVSQLNFLLQALPKPAEKEKRPIGFQIPD